MYYPLSGLSCSNCAFKIEQELRKINGMERAKVNFVNQSLEIPPEHLEKARQALARIEPEVKILAPNSNSIEITAPASKGRLFPIIITSLLLIIGMVFNTHLHQTPFSWAEYLVLLSAYLLVGWPVLSKAVHNVGRGQIFDENFLMSTATLGAVAIHQLNEAVAVMLLYAIGEYFQDRAVNHSRRSIAALINLRPDYANLSVNGKIVKVNPEEVAIGQTIVIKPGEKVPLDGHVIDGVSFVDTAVLTGESKPRKVAVGKKVLAGMVNGQGLLTVKVSKPFRESSVARIMELVEDAAGRKAPTDRFITAFARYYTPVVFFGALALAIIPPLIIPEATFDTWIYRALVLLVISCPCALIISIPLGYFAGLGNASRQGILIKGANFLEALTNLKAVVFDKTGTLTKGEFRVKKVVAVNNFSKEQVLALATAAEAYSNHPIALSIRQAFGRKVALDKISDYQEMPGCGISAVVAGKKILVGNDRILQQKMDHFDPPEGTRVHVVVAGIHAGWIIIADEIKANTEKMIAKLKEIGIKQILMLTGDEKSVAQGVAARLGIDSFYAELLPEEKVHKVEQLRSALPKPQKQKIAFVGDGINDAPVLARADVGIAMGALGADAAIEAADVILMDDNPAKLVTAINIARYTNRIIWQNVFLALGIKAFFLFLGTHGLASIWEAVFADVGVTLIAILNATRILKYQDTGTFKFMRIYNANYANNRDYRQ